MYLIHIGSDFWCQQENGRDTKYFGKGSKVTETDTKSGKVQGVNKKQVHACRLRADGYTQIDAYCLSHKVSAGDKVENKGPIEDKAYKLFRKPKVKAYLRELLAAKTLEELLSRQEWILGLLDDIESAREAKNWPAVMNGQRMIGQAIAALREGLVAIKDGAERDREIIDALAGEDPKKRKALELLMGSDSVFPTPHLVSDTSKQ